MSNNNVLTNILKFKFLITILDQYILSIRVNQYIFVLIGFDPTKIQILRRS